MSGQTLEQRVSALEKEIAELKVQVSERREVDIKEIIMKINLCKSTSDLLKL